MFSGLGGDTDAQRAAKMKDILPALRDVAPDLADELWLRCLELMGIATSARQAAMQGGRQ